jgi:transcriptional regulator with XRE-family HTH domain
MKEINLADVLVSKRREKGVTQDELASYIGVSKASVSKWETGQSYPDITFLPQLAAYFNISIDDLMDYKPQMTKEDIRKLYLSLAADFAQKPFDDVLGRCRETIKKYYACFPLLLQMGTLILNHSMLANDPAKTAELLREALALFVRVKRESGDAALAKQALFMEAFCHLSLGEPNETLALLDGTVELAMPPETLLASAYQMSGRPAEAKTTLQIGIYQNIVVLFNYLPQYLALCMNEPDAFDETLRRALAVGDAFDLARLHPGVFIGVHLTAAAGYAARGEREKALDMLERYAEIVTGDIYPLTLHGDAFFTLLGGWLETIDLGPSLPRSEKTVRRSMAEAVAANPAFAPLCGEPRFLLILEKLQHNREEV